MPFIVETGPRHSGIKLYISKPEPPSRALRLAGIRDNAVLFPTLLDADVHRRRFSSLYGLMITEAKT